MTDDTSPLGDTGLLLGPSHAPPEPAPIDGHTPASNRFRQLLRLVKVVGSVALAALLIYGFIVIQGQSSALARRSPTLDYMACHDSRQDDALEATFIYLDVVITNASVGGYTEAEVAEVREEWVAARSKLEKATDRASDTKCPSLPE